MRILVLGGSGRVGSELVSAADRARVPHRGTYFSRPQPGLVPLDVRDAAGVRELLAEYRPDVVLWAAPAFEDAVAEVAAEVAKTDAKFVFVSGDGVFGECRTAMLEEDALAPADELAEAQAAAELAVQRCLPERHLIVRTGHLFGTRSKSDPLNRLIRTASRGETVAHDDTSFLMPTFAPDFADAVLKLLKKGTTGTVHVVGPERHTRFSFARTAAMVCGLDADLVQPTDGIVLEGPRRVWLDRFRMSSILGRTAVRSVGDGVRAVRDRSRVAVPMLKAA